MKSNVMALIGQGRCHAENYASGILSLNLWKGDNNVLALGAYKNGLPLCVNQYYTAKAPAKSGAGRGNPDMYKATPDAYSVFFIVVKSAHLHSAAQIRTESMVALVGQLSGWPVSLYAGISTPISVTTNHERGNSGGDLSSQYKEIIIMMATPTQTPSKSQYRFRFLALCATGSAIIHITAPDEHAARGMSPVGFVMIFAARLPAEVNHA